MCVLDIVVFVDIDIVYFVMIVSCLYYCDCFIFVDILHYFFSTAVNTYTFVFSHLLWYLFCFVCVFFFKQKTAYEVRIRDWSSDVCSSDLGWLSRWDDRRGTPVNAFIVQGVIALLLVIGGSFSRDGFQSAVEYTAPVFWFFLLLMGISLFILRRRRGGAKPPFAVPLYPLLPAIFCLTSAYLLYASLAYAGLGATVGAGVVAAGGMLLFFLKPRIPEETR